MSEYASVERLQSLKSAIEAKTEETYGDLTEAVQGLSDRVTDIIETASGEVISLNDSFNAPLRGLTIYGKSIQDGTPSPDAPIPIVSTGDDGEFAVNVVGRNLIPFVHDGKSVTKYGITYTVNDDGTVTANGTAEKTNEFPVVVNINLPAGKYTFSGCPSGGVNGKYLINPVARYNTTTIVDTWETGTGLTFNAPNGVTYVAFYLRVYEGVTVSNLVFKPMLNAGATALPYEPYKLAQSLPITTPLCGIPVTKDGNYTDASGQQWVTDEIDFVRGVKIQRCNTVILTGNENVASYGTSGTNGVYISNVFPENLSRAKGVCSHAVVDHGNVKAGVVWIGVSNRNLYWIDIISVLGVETTTDVKAYISEQYSAGTPVTLTYKMNTPVETPLTEEELSAYANLRMNYPNTTIYTDDNVRLVVTYRVDIMNYIEHGGAYEVGRQAEYDAFWDTIQYHGEPGNYEQRFFGFNGELFKPKYDFKFSGTSSYSAHGSFRTSSITDMIKNCDFTALNNNIGLMYTFYECGGLVNARTLKVSDFVKYTSSFRRCRALEEVRFDGVIGQNGLDFNESPKLSKASITSIINALSSTTSGLTVSLSKTAVETAFTTDEWDALAGTKPNWTISLV